MSKYLGVFAASHNSSICIFDDEKFEFEYFAEERLTRQKNIGGYPLESIKNIISKYKNEIVDNTQYSGNCYSRSMIEVENLFLNTKKKNLLLSLTNNLILANKNKKFKDLSHHLSHMYACLTMHPYSESVIVVIDGFASKKSDYTEWLCEEDKYPDHFNDEPRESVSVYYQKDHEIKCLYKEYEEVYFVDLKGKRVATGSSLGNLYAAAAYQVFADWKHSGKLMGLSIYGNPDQDILKKYSTPSSFLHDYILKTTFNWCTKKEFDQLPNEEFQKRADFAATVQKFYEIQLMKIMKKVEDLQPHVKNLVFAGGCALNCLANDLLVRDTHFSKVHVIPYPDDTGISIGAAFGHYFLNNPYVPIKTYEEMNGAIGPIINNFDTHFRLDFFENKYSVELMDSLKSMSLKIVEDILTKNIVAMAYGRSEAGPRALCNRSILANPFAKDIVKNLNNNIKFREKFRPYGLVILQSEVDKYFEVKKDYHSPFMSFAPKVRKEYQNLFKEIITPNKTIRIQTVTKGQHHIYEILNALKDKNLPPCLINTSLNVMGEPICESVTDYFALLDATLIATGYLGLYRVLKK